MQTIYKQNTVLTNDVIWTSLTEWRWKIVCMERHDWSYDSELKMAEKHNISIERSEI